MVCGVRGNREVDVGKISQGIEIVRCIEPAELIAGTIARHILEIGRGQRRSAVIQPDPDFAVIENGRLRARLRAEQQKHGKQQDQ